MPDKDEMQRDFEFPDGPALPASLSRGVEIGELERAVNGFLMASPLRDIDGPRIRL